MGNNDNIVISYFYCPDCNMRITVPRDKFLVKDKEPVKELYCPKCDKVQKMQIEKETFKL